MNAFSELGLIAPLHQAVTTAGYTVPTPIQAQAIPPVLAGRDLLGCARTGTGKTAAFALPILQRLSASPARGPGRPVRALVLVPTRELAAQVCESFQTYGSGLHLTTAVIYGGVGQGPQVNALRRGVDILVATPGRLVDLMGQGLLKLGHIEVLVLDEADHMLDLGFIPDVRKVLAVVPKQRQTLFFSATMPPPIAKLAATILSRPVEVIVTPVASTVDAIDQHVHLVSRSDKARMLTEILQGPTVESALVFTRTKRGADRVSKRLGQDGIRAEAIHGNKSQNNRERTLDAFRERRLRVLVATDIAARGIDVDGITHVVNYELPNVPEVYVHRIGRTGRAGASGFAISLCDEEERPLLRDIEKLLRRDLPKSGGSGAGSRRGTHGRVVEEPARASAARPARPGRPGSTDAHVAPSRTASRPHAPAAAARHEPATPFGAGVDGEAAGRSRSAAAEHRPHDSGRRPHAPERGEHGTGRPAHGSHGTHGTQGSAGRAHDAGRRPAAAGHRTANSDHRPAATGHRPGGSGHRPAAAGRTGERHSEKPDSGARQGGSRRRSGRG